MVADPLLRRHDALPLRVCGEALGQLRDALGVVRERALGGRLQGHHCHLKDLPAAKPDPEVGRSRGPVGAPVTVGGLSLRRQGVVFERNVEIALPQAEANLRSPVAAARGGVHPGVEGGKLKVRDARVIGHRAAIDLLRQAACLRDPGARQHVELPLASRMQDLGIGGEEGILSGRVDDDRSGLSRGGRGGRSGRRRAAGLGCAELVGGTVDAREQLGQVEGRHVSTVHVTEHTLARNSEDLLDRDVGHLLLWDLKRGPEEATDGRVQGTQKAVVERGLEEPFHQLLRRVVRLSILRRGTRSDPLLLQAARTPNRLGRPPIHHRARRPIPSRLVVRTGCHPRGGWEGRGRSVATARRCRSLPAPNC